MKTWKTMKSSIKIDKKPKTFEDKVMDKLYPERDMLQQLKDALAKAAQQELDELNLRINGVWKVKDV